MATVRTDAYQLPLPAGWSDRTAVTNAAAKVSGSGETFKFTGDDGFRDSKATSTIRDCAAPE